MAGYSGTPLLKKLGIKSGYTIRLVDAPEYYFNLFEVWPEDVKILRTGNLTKNIIHFFVKKHSMLKEKLPQLKNELVPDGMIWVSWPKKAAKVETDITEDVIRNEALSIGLVDVKVCAVDDTWSALKLVIPVKDRSKNV